MSNEMSETGGREAQAFDTLVRLALDLRWSWNHSTDELWQAINPQFWELTHNPWILLQSASPQKLQSVMMDPSIQTLLTRLLEEQKTLEAPAWFHNEHPHSALKLAAYFSMEYMLSEALPIYSGGLGNVAGDQLKAASDLGAPVIAVGLLYQQGYFRQRLSADGKQQALYPYNEPGQLPIVQVRTANGEWLRLSIQLPGSRLWVRAWQVQVGRNKLYLLDTNVPANEAAARGITSQLYGGDEELRLQQELVLGIGGWQLLRALNLDPEICHLNEGHAAFAVLERARCWMKDHSKDFDLAMTVTRIGNLFTTHTAVSAGFDRFPPELIAKYFRQYAEADLGISLETLLALGRLNPDDDQELFNMAYLALRGSGSINGVSRLHGEVSRALFQPFFPRWPQQEVPVRYVTNGVHVPSWDSVHSDQLWTVSCGKERWREMPSSLEQTLRKVKDADLWQMRSSARKSLIEETRTSFARQLAAQGAADEEIAAGKAIFDPDVFTIGFARRFATYKRPNLLLHDPERLLRILTNSRFPVQLVLAGKAHPHDLAAQAMIRQWFQFMRRPEARAHVVFLADYDMRKAESLIQGVDLWINTPRRPWEACGTSGMKVLVNGGLNLSELDGWWAEAYTPEVGWAIGDGEEHGEDPAWDAAEANTLYCLLEQEIVPAFYRRDEHGIPSAWIAKMRESMARLTPRFSANRAVREYTQNHYLPAAKMYRERTERDGALGEQLRAWSRQIEQRWTGLRFGDLKVEKEKDLLLFTVHVYFGELDPNAVKVELYAEGVAGGESIHQEMQRDQPLVGSVNGYAYSSVVPADRSANDYTPRIIPHKEGAAVPLEAGQILWQR